MKQLIVLNPNTGEWFEVGEWGEDLPNGGDNKYISHGGNAVHYISFPSGDYPLTSLEPGNVHALAYQLGMRLIEIVPEEHRDRITGELGPVSGHAYYVSIYSGRAYQGPSTLGNRIHLSPPPPPPPPPAKTTREVLTELTAALALHQDGGSHFKVVQKLEAAKRHLMNKPETGV